MMDEKNIDIWKDDWKNGWMDERWMDERWMEN